MKRALLSLLVLGVLASAVFGAVTVGGPIAPDGKTPVTVDLPVDQRIHNIGSHVDGAGMCVMSSIEMSAHWGHVESMRGLRDWCAQQAGGAYPAKVDKQIQQYAAVKSVPIPGYVQVETKDPAVLDLTIKTGRLPAVTYSGRDGVRYQGTIAHMVTLVHLDAERACVLDNNEISEGGLLWMTRQDFLSRWADGSGQGWAFIWLSPPPSPPPHPTPKIFTQGPALQLPDPVDPAYSWRTRPDDPARRYLFRGGVQVGAWDADLDYYRPYESRTRAWGPEGARPAGTPPTDDEARAAARRDNFGVERRKLECCRERWSLNGRECPREEAAGGLADDSARLRLTVIGPDADRAAVLRDLAAAPVLAWARERCLVQDYAPHEWAAARCGFATAGRPTVYLQSPSGQVLHRQDDYEGGADQLSAALRKADPDYRPDRDPDQRKTPQPAPGGPGTAADGTVVLAGGVLAAVMLAGLALLRRPS